MRLECNRDSLGAAGASPGNDLPQNMRMRAMHTVEIPHADECGAKVDRDILEFVEDQHGSPGKKSSSF